MPVRNQLGDEIQVVGYASQLITAAATQTFDFGTPNDLRLDVNANGYDLASGDRVVVVFTSHREAGNTSSITFVVQDADNNAGAIGTPATAVTDGDALSDAGVANGIVVVGVTLQQGRPWLRLQVTSSDATDDVYVTATVLAIKPGL